ncbi:trifunctional serine/threonine-protein kinase/ATP-binding protein/sensor histidine kinase [Piscinibacter sp. XHJ-5]|uniref:trifunctional serine/threonine-protein kinase/ATP-binding protein/sensor histidine kinase n=1 Tax=Piscinibacter sp. XHJ-5 TaxID=3037797 RepID=UPI0024530F6D|nr:trifunctional serine/threonine-protein kinase/ATP-binding protein/sensor histidine kinase [Piscinibacter sp. XHJ-5]
MDLSGYTLDILREDSGFALCRGRAAASPSLYPPSVLVTILTSDHPRPDRVRMLEREFAMRTELDSTWSIRPLALAQYRGHAALILEDQQGQPLDRVLATPPVIRPLGASPSAGPAIELGLFLRIAVGIAAALGGVHRRGIIHKDIKPANVIVNTGTGQVWLTGFGAASRLPRERQAPEPPETIAGTLPYMAPEQTGRMNRSHDGRSDLYSLGVTLYEMLTGSLPFNAADPMEWVHCHIARQAMPPSERMKHVPPIVSTIIMKLLAKTAEERYQTAAGLENDLRHCLAQFEAEGRVDAFALGERDTPDRLLIPEKLYGRAREIEILLAAFDRIVAGGAPELVLVCGYSGIGKSSVVNELHRVLVPPRGLFAAGKFDQYKRDIPYSTLAQAFQGLVRLLLAKSDVELLVWREALREALGPNGQLIVELVPELTLIVGEQPPVPQLPPQDAQRRFQLVFRRFLGVFARQEHPLALFLDDLQWLDAATLDLLKDLLKQADMRHLLLIGAYRDNEVTSAHPLMRTLDKIRNAGARASEIVLAPLVREDVDLLVADSLFCSLVRAAPLSELVHKKTGGNPFFVIQFLAALVEEGLLTFDHGAACWSWDLARIHAKGYTDNVVDLMASKLGRLSINAQHALQQLACLGNNVESTVLAMVHEDSSEEPDCDLDEAMRAGLILCSEGVYRFLHDRVQEAAYSQIPEARRAETHLRIGRLLAAHTPVERQKEAIFEIVNQLNRGASLIRSRDEKERLAELNLAAGKRAKAATAYVSALRYLVAGAELLSEGGWQNRPDLMFALELHRAECEFLTGDMASAEARLTMLASRAFSSIDHATVACLRIDLYMTLDRNDRAVDVCLAYLHLQGTEWTPHPSEEEARREYDRTWSLLGGREIEGLVDLPLMSDPAVVATVDVLTRALTPTLYTDPNLLSLLVCRLIHLSLEYGNTDGSCLAYVWLGRIAGSRFGNYQAGFRFGRLGHDLVERSGMERFKARTYISFGNFCLPWSKHVRAGRDLIRRAFDAANANGDLTHAAFSCNNLITNLLATGDPLIDVQREAERGLAFARDAGFGAVIHIITTQLGLVRTLRGLTATFGCFNDEQFDESQFERGLSNEPDASGAPIAACRYWTRKLQARFLAGDYSTAVVASLNVQRLLWTGPSVLESAEAHLYGALTHAASCDARFPLQYREHVDALTAHYRQLVEWEEHCPENFRNRAALVGAEIARIEGRELDAERLYEEAIRSARENEFVHNEALANELAARFHAARGFDTISEAYLRNARYGFLRWGADGKVRQLDQLHPHLRTVEAAPVSTGTIGALGEQLDLATVITVSQTVSGEMVLEKLLDTVMRTAIEQAGAERAVLMLSTGTGQRIVAEATTSNDTVIVRVRDEPMTASTVPETIVRYVLHTHQNVVLDNAAALNPFSTDPYVRQRNARSILCLPLSSRARIVGVLYLENNLAPRVFAPARATVLKVLAAQAAMSLENARLYRDVAEREAKIRRLVDSNIIGIFICELEGRILEANDAFLAMVGFDREDLVAHELRWTELTPPEWRDRDERLMIELRASGTLQPFEKEYLRKDGSRVPVLVGVASFDGTGNQAVAYVVDLTERRQAQEALSRASDELAHVSRVTALSALTASIAHEVNQPLSGIMTNASTCLRMLDATPANIDGARETARRTIRDGKRASQVIVRLRELFSKREFTLESLDLNEATREIIALLLHDLQRNRVILQAELEDDLPMVFGDRIQLQQVILNLVRNASDAMVDVHDRPRQLLIKTEQEGRGRVRLSVCDAGVGLSAQSLDSLFNPFYTTKNGGMGIGLFVSRSIIERHHGRLGAQPNQGGPGATFSFSIPSDAADGYDKEPATTPAH